MKAANVKLSIRSYPTNQSESDILKDNTPAIKGAAICPKAIGPWM